MDSNIFGDKFIIEGQNRLSGEVRLKGFKNNSIKLIPAAILIDGEVTLRDVPDLLDVSIALEIFRELGGNASFDKESGICKLDGRNINSFEINSDHSKRFRGSVSFLGPLYARFGQARATFPGGDKIGVRDINTHFQVFESLGAEIVEEGEGQFLIKGNITNYDFMLEQPSVTASENAIMSSIFSKGTVRLFNVACEPHVRELCVFLNKAGAKISGVGSNLLTIQGVEKLNPIDYTLCSDPLDAGLFIIAAAITNGNIKISNVNLYDLNPILTQFKKLGVNIIIHDENTIEVPDNLELKVNNSYWGGIYSQPWPLFPSDLMSPTITLATQCEGHILFFEKLYEARMNFTSQLISMGADIFVADPHRVIVNGKTQLYGSQVSSLDVRAGVAVLLAALCAKGQSEVIGIKHIDRGFDHIETTLNSLGAKIRRV